MTKEIYFGQSIMFCFRGSEWLQEPEDLWGFQLLLQILFSPQWAWWFHQTSHGHMGTWAWKNQNKNAQLAFWCT